MNIEITEEMEMEIRKEIDTALSILRVGRNYRDYSEETIDTLYPHIANIIYDDLVAHEDEEDIDRLAVDEDMVITAMMMELAGDV